MTKTDTTILICFFWPWFTLACLLLLYTPTDTNQSQITETVSTYSTNCCTELSSAAAVESQTEPEITTGQDLPAAEITVEQPTFSPEYLKAAEIWSIMKEFGWSDAACAGILGNIMREVGGGTLSGINETRFNKRGTHFGLCQWSAKYYPDIQPTKTWMPSIREQMEFLRLTIREYNGHGFAYGFTEEYLMTAADPAEVAKLFCEGYERPNEDSTKRESYAIIAYNYFTNQSVSE